MVHKLKFHEREKIFEYLNKNYKIEEIALCLNRHILTVYREINCLQETYEMLSNTRSRKEGLVLVLKYPFIPLHNNDSERDIREYVKKRKISGSTRSDEGRKARDTFTSLKKTCMKLKICFYDYLKDRLINMRKIPKLSELIKEKSKGLSYSLPT